MLNDPMERENLQMNPGKVAKRARVMRDWTLPEAANRIGVAYNTLAGLENGTKHTRWETVVAILNELGIDVVFRWRDDFDSPIENSGFNENDL
jgi:transcriptional regulator with XRE-family HTH domain